VEAEDFTKWSVKELKSELKDRGLGCSGCFEKSDFIGKLSEAMSM
jgi:hypothetical protein